MGRAEPNSTIPGWNECHRNSGRSHFTAPSSWTAATLSSDDEGIGSIHSLGNKRESREEGLTVVPQWNNLLSRGLADPLLPGCKCD